MTAVPVPPGRRRRALPPDFIIMNPALVDQLSLQQCLMIAETLRKGGVVWFMSDCAYALGVDPRHPLGVAALDALLDHSGLPIPLTVADDAVASKIIRYSDQVRALTAKFWPGGLGIRTHVHSRLGRLIVKRVHGTDGVVVRMSQSIIERQISATLRLPITSAALRLGGVLVDNSDAALDLAIELSETHTPGLRTIFIRDPRHKPALRDHSTMVGLQNGHLSVLRHGSIDADDARKVAYSNHGVNWGDAT